MQQQPALLLPILPASSRLGSARLFHLCWLSPSLVPFRNRVAPPSPSYPVPPPEPARASLMAASRRHLLFCPGPPWLLAVLQHSLNQFHSSLVVRTQLGMGVWSKKGWKPMNIFLILCWLC
ncbi:hypothetical protein ABPG77_008195 [Micractinium sp. CCAP 211/92]